MLVGVSAYETGVVAGEGNQKCLALKCFKIMIPVLFILGLVIFSDNISYQDEILYPYIFACLINGLYFVTKKPINVFLKKIILYFGQLSYFIFLFHYGVCYLFNMYIVKKEYIIILPYLASVLGASIFIKFINMRIKILLS